MGDIYNIDNFNFPDNWEGYEDFVEVEAESNEQINICLLLIEYRNFVVDRIIRFQSPGQYLVYSGINEEQEKSVWHGTYAMNLTSLLENGFDISKSKLGNFGKGIYFTEDPTKAHKYTKKHYGNYVLLKCKIKPGVTKVYPDGVNDLHLKHRGDADTVEGKISLAKEIVVYDPRRILIEYIIYYNVI